MRNGDHKVLANVLSLLLCGVLAGVVVAAAAFPAIAMSGLAAKTGARAFADLPTELTVKRSPQMSKIYANDGKTLLASIYDENRQDIHRHNDQAFATSASSLDAGKPPTEALAA